ncbi:MAG: DEAD/DEAH box helicase [Parcubacteria group bacterium]
MYSKNYHGSRRRRQDFHQSKGAAVGKTFALTKPASAFVSKPSLFVDVAKYRPARKNFGNRSGFQFGQSFAPSRSFGANRGSGRFNRPANSNKKEFSDVSKFVHKAMPLAVEIDYVPVNSFADFAIDERLKKNVFKAKYACPTPIQDKVIPLVLAGRDIVGTSNTGTGKTAAFIVPLLNKVIKDKTQKILIMAPTRELAIQINQEFGKFAFGLGIFSVCVVGGMPIFRQMTELRRSYNFLIGTPGRIKDLLERRCFNLKNFKTVVLDESDRMLDMGFIGDMRFLIAAMPKERQTLLFSATLSHDIKNIIYEFLNDPVSVTVKTGDTAKGVDQDVVYFKGGAKFSVLHALLQKPEFSKVLIFGRTKHGVEKLSKLLANCGLRAESIHGNKNHGQRQRALTAFKANAAKILVATDVASRGLDIPNVTHVINYELPATYEDYIHRIGRTGRMGKTGKALTFIE